VLLLACVFWLLAHEWSPLARLWTRLVATLAVPAPTQLVCVSRSDVAQRLASLSAVTPQAYRLQVAGPHVLRLARRVLAHVTST